MEVCMYDLASFQHRSTDHYENWHVYVFFCGKGFSAILFVAAPPPGGTTVYQLLHRSINRQVAYRVAENNANLALSPTSRYVFIESPL
ncbi:uncharacterized protein TNCV_4521701 [Trichonephila clavipes]|nr:uncharacterized protein TNCV_4521701 [Trichonephila clavipes]